LTEKERKVGSRGQVTIPKAMREALKIETGSKVTFRLEGEKLVVRRFFDAVAIFKRIAKEINYNGEIDPHAYEEELEERYQRALSGEKKQEEKSS
jgi:AbrB family looped-hinge helix DNA binding protein